MEQRLKNNTNQVFLIIWLRWHLFVNDNRSLLIKNKFYSAAFYTLLVALFCFFFGFSSGFIFKEAYKVNQERNWIEYSNTLFFSFLVGLLFLRIFISGSFINRPDRTTIKRLPISDLSLFTGNFISDLWNILYVGYFSVLLGFYLGVGVLDVTVGSIFIIIGLSVWYIILIHFLLEIFHTGMNQALSFIKKFRRIAVGVILILILIYCINIFDTQHFYQQLVLISPIGLLNHAIYSLVQNDYMSSILLYLLCSVITIIIGTPYLLKANKIEAYTDNNPQWIKNISIWIDSKLNKALSFIFPSLNVYIGKEIKYLFRTKKTMWLFISELLWYCFLIYQYSADSILSVNIYFYLFMIQIPTVYWEYHTDNHYGFERDGFGLYLLFPIIRKDIIISKSLGIAIFRFPLFLFSCIITWSLHGINITAIAVFLQISSSIMLLIIGNYNSIRNPKRVARKEHIVGISQDNQFTLAGLLGILILFFYPIISIGIFYISKSFIMISSILILCILFFIYVYSRTLKYFDKIFVQRSEFILKELRRI